MHKLHNCNTGCQELFDEHCFSDVSITKMDGRKNYFYQGFKNRNVLNHSA